MRTVKLQQTRTPHRERGIALSQVLLLVAIISTFIVSMLHTNKSYIDTALAVKARVSADLKLKNAESHLLEALLTHSWEEGLDTNNAIAARWNFYGEPFWVDDVQFVIQNDSSLFQVTRTDSDYLEKGLRALQISDARTLALALSDWQDADSRDQLQGAETTNNGSVPNRPVQSFGEIGLIDGFSESMIEKIRPLSTLNTYSFDSPGQAPNSLLTVYMASDQAKRLKEARALERPLNSREITEITGLMNDEFQFLDPGPVFKVRMTTTIEGIRQMREFTVELSPYANEPLIRR